MTSCTLYILLGLLGLNTAIATKLSSVQPSGDTFEAFLFAKMTPINLVNVSIHVADELEWYSCPPLPHNGSDPTVYVLLQELPCMPHHITILQSDCGFDAVLLVHSSKLVDFFRTGMWTGRHHYRIPMYHTTDSHIDWHSVDTLTLVLSDEPVYFESDDFFLQAIIMGSICSLAALLKLFAALKRLYFFKGREYSSKIPFLILILESITSVFVIIYSIDPFGVFGIYSFSFSMVQIGIIFNGSFLTTCFCWYIFILIEKATQMKHTNSVLTFFKVALCVYSIANAGVFFLISLGHIFNGMLEAIGLFDALTQTIVGFSFLRIRKKIFQELQSTKTGARVTSETESRRTGERNRLLQKCGTSIIGYVIVTVFTEFSFYLTDSLTAWYGVYLSLLSLTIIGYFQVSSVKFSKSRQFFDSSYPRIKSGKVLGMFDSGSPRFNSSRGRAEPDFPSKFGSSKIRVEPDYPSSRFKPSKAREESDSSKEDDKANII